MDKGEDAPHNDRPDGTLQEEGARFDGGRGDEAAVQLDAGGRIEEEEFFEDCMEELRVQFEECMDRLGTQFGGRADEKGDGFEDEATPPASGVDELAAQIEECMAELGIQLGGCADGSGPLLRGLAEDVSAWSEDSAEDLGSQLKGRMEEVRLHCGGGVRELGTRFEEHIQEVALLEEERDRLVEELLRLEEPMAQAVQALRAEAGELRRLLARAELERWNLQEERRRVKRQLFAVARDCTQSRVTLATQQHEVEQFTIMQGELQVQAQLLTEEMEQLKEAQQNRLNALRCRLDSLSAEARARGDPSQCRQASWDLSHYLQDGIKALEEQYEPRLQALLKRKQAAADALQGTRAETQELRARLGPLREEAQRLGLQRVCLEERIALMRREREESVAQYRGTVEALEETSRELKTELQIQRKQNQEMQTLKDGLIKELELFRGSTELCGKLNLPSEGT